MTQEEALRIMKTGVNVYLTGSAGSGKTFLLNQYINYLNEHDIPVAVTASTGIAATHMNGMTIHGWSGIGIRETLTERDLDDLESKKYLWSRFEKARVLIIDEVSMLHASRLDMVDKVLRRFKQNEAPFGGLQVILSGDFFQLPPINKNRNVDNDINFSSKEMVFNSNAWKSMRLAICYITEQHRQEDEIFTEILNKIRQDDLEEMHFEEIEKRMHLDIEESQTWTKLYTHNIDVDNLNNIELGKIDSETKIYQMETAGNEVLVGILKKSCLAQETLYLKKGAEVMFIKNNLEGAYVNGSRGKVVDFYDEDITTSLPIVELYNGKRVYVKKEEWIIEENGKKKASITQLPIRLAWAITIHKSQGMSLDSAIIDLSKSFSYGMGYVALSRVRTLKGIHLLGINPNALKVDPVILELDKKLQKESDNNSELFNNLSEDDQKKLEEDFIIRMGGNIKKVKVKDEKNKFVKVPSIMLTKELLDEGKSLEEIIEIRKLVFSTIISHVEELIEKGIEVKIDHIKPKKENIERVAKANNKLKDDKKGKLSPLKSALDKEGSKITFEEIRLARLFI
ncbi:MAG: AAA family ATPase [Candidatus Pacebacteria bacterium]|nr:AAA family ATPase [Candidatus Paceibacterota bacterium]